MDMKYRMVGKTGISVSAAGIETHQWSGMGGRYFSLGEVHSFVGHAAELGMNFIDTGECYRNHGAERLIGEAILARRENWIIATKFGHENAGDKNVSCYSRESLEKQLYTSLQALGTAYVDLYQVHINTPEDGPHFLRSIDAVAAFLEDEKKNGRIRHAGICLGDNELFDERGELFEAAAEKIPFGAVQVAYNRLDRAAESRVIPLAKRLGLGIIVRAPLAKGYLSSRFRPEKDFDVARMKMAEKVKSDEVPTGMDLAEWAIGWCLRDGAVATVIPGCSAIGQLDSTAAAIERAGETNYA